VYPDSVLMVLGCKYDQSAFQRFGLKATRSSTFHKKSYKLGWRRRKKSKSKRRERVSNFKREKLLSKLEESTAAVHARPS
jgi:hypothetical protein